MTVDEIIEKVKKLPPRLKVWVAGMEVRPCLTTDDLGRIANALTGAEKSLEKIFSKAVAFQPDSPGENVILYRWVGEIKSEALEAISRIKEGRDG
jgi:hypothetical protein